MRSFDHKLQRAEYHLDALYEVLEPILDPRNYDLITNVKAQPREISVEFSFTRIPPLPIEEISALTSDCLQNLRDTLDHLAFALVMKTRPAIYKADEKLWKYVSFYICTEGDVTIAPLGGKTKYWPAGAAQELQKLNPCKAGCYDLWLLAWLNNITKHRYIATLIPTAYVKALEGGRILPIQLGVDSPTIEAVRRSGFHAAIGYPFDPSKEDGYGHFYGLKPNTKYEPDFTLEIEIHEPGIAVGKPLFLTMKQLLRTVREVIGRFSQHL